MLGSSMNAKFESIRYLDWNFIVFNWMRVGSPLLYPARVVTIDNWTDADLMFSTVYYDLNQDPFAGEIAVAATSGKVFDVSANTYNNSINGQFAFPAGTQFWVRQIEAPNEKAVYISVIYGSEQ